MMDGLEIKAALILIGVSHKEIAAEAGVAITNVSSIVLGRRRSKPVEEVIARHLKKSREQVFGLNMREQGKELEK